MRAPLLRVAACAAIALSSACAPRATPSNGVIAVWISVTHDQIRFDSRIDDPDEALFKILEVNGVRVERGSPLWVIHLDDPTRVDSLLRDHVRGVRTAMDVVANNIANAETTDAGSVVETEAGGVSFVRYKPYRRKIVRFCAWNSATEPQEGESPYDVIEVPGQLEADYNPEHPHAVCSPEASDRGYLYRPNVSPLIETCEMVRHVRAYEALTWILGELQRQAQRP